MCGVSEIGRCSQNILECDIWYCMLNTKLRESSVFVYEKLFDNAFKFAL